MRKTKEREVEGRGKWRRGKEGEMKDWEEG